MAFKPSNNNNQNNSSVDPLVQKEEGIGIKPSNFSSEEEGEITFKAETDKIVSFVDGQERNIVTDIQAETLENKSFRDCTLGEVSGTAVDATTLSNSSTKIPSTKAVENYIQELGGIGDLPENLSELSDVNLTNPQNGDLLAYNTGTQEWENRQITGLQKNPIIRIPLNNNVTDVNVPGFIFDKVNKVSGLYTYTTYRKTGDSTSLDNGQLIISNSVKADTLSIDKVNSETDNSGITFSIDNVTGQVSYSTNDRTGYGHVAELVIYETFEFDIPDNIPTVIGSLIVTSQPPSLIKPNENFGLTIEFRDLVNTPVSAPPGTTVDITILNDPSGNAILSGTTSVTLPSGGSSVVVSDLQINNTADGYTLQATSSIYNSVTTNSINVQNPVASTLNIITQPSNTIQNEVITPAPAVELRDQFGDIFTDIGGNFNVSINNNPSAGTLGGTTSLSSALGTVSFNNLQIDNVGVGYTLDFDYNGILTQTTSSFEIESSLADSIIISTQPPATLAAGQAIPVEFQAVNSGTNGVDTGVNTGIALLVNGTVSTTNRIFLDSNDRQFTNGVSNNPFGQAFRYEGNVTVAARASFNSNTYDSPASNSINVIRSWYSRIATENDLSVFTTSNSENNVSLTSTSVPGEPAKTEVTILRSDFKSISGTDPSGNYIGMSFTINDNFDRSGFDEPEVEIGIYDADNDIIYAAFFDQQKLVGRRGSFSSPTFTGDGNNYFVNVNDNIEVRLIRMPTTGRFEFTTYFNGSPVNSISNLVTTGGTFVPYIRIYDINEGTYNPMISNITLTNN